MGSVTLLEYFIKANDNHTIKRYPPCPRIGRRCGFAIANCYGAIVGKQAEIAYYNVYCFTGVLNIMEKFNNIAQLKDSGLKVTGPRLKILDLFETHAEEHLSAEDVYRILLEEGVEIGVATIYRVLTQFEQAGILQRHHFETGKAVFF